MNEYISAPLDGFGYNTNQYAPDPSIEGQVANNWGTGGDLGVNVSEDPTFNHQPIELSEFPPGGFDFTDLQFMEKLLGDISNGDSSTVDPSGYLCGSGLEQWPSADSQIEQTLIAPGAQLANTKAGDSAVTGIETPNEFANASTSQPFLDTYPISYPDTSWIPPANAVSTPVADEISSASIADSGIFVDDLTDFLEETGPEKTSPDDNDATDTVPAGTPSPAPADTSDEPAKVEPVEDEHNSSPDDDKGTEQLSNEPYIQYPWHMYNQQMQHGYDPYCFPPPHPQGFMPYLPPPPQEVIPPGVHPNFRPPPQGYPFGPAYGFPYGYPPHMVYYPPGPENGPMPMYNPALQMPMMGIVPPPNTPTIGSGNFSQYPYSHAHAKASDKKQMDKGKVNLPSRIAPSSISKSSSTSKSKTKKQKSLTGARLETVLTKELLTSPNGHVDQSGTGEEEVDPNRLRYLQGSFSNTVKKKSERRGKDVVKKWAYIDQDGIKVFIIDRNEGLMARWSEEELQFLIWAFEMRQGWDNKRISERMIRFSTREGYPGVGKEQVRVKRQIGAIATQYGRLARKNKKQLDFTDPKVRGLVDSFEAAYPPEVAAMA